MSGLGGHAYGSFRSKVASSDYMWLRDSLPTDMPFARVTIYGYNSKVVGSLSWQSIDHLAKRFCADLKRLCKVQMGSARPVILLGHSLGGLIMKQAIVILSKSGLEEDRILHKSTCGLVCFGVPHSGMNVESLILMAGESAPNRALIKSLEVDSPVLQTLSEAFLQAAGGKGDLEVHCHFETVRSPTAMV